MSKRRNADEQAVQEGEAFLLHTRFATAGELAVRHGPRDPQTPEAMRYARQGLTTPEEIRQRTNALAERHAANMASIAAVTRINYSDRRAEIFRNVAAAREQTFINMASMDLAADRYEQGLEAGEEDEPHPFLTAEEVREQYEAEVAAHAGPPAAPHQPNERRTTLDLAAQSEQMQEIFNNIDVHTYVLADYSPKEPSAPSVAALLSNPFASGKAHVRLPAWGSNDPDQTPARHHRHVLPHVAAPGVAIPAGGGVGAPAVGVPAAAAVGGPAAPPGAPPPAQPDIGNYLVGAGILSGLAWVSVGNNPRPPPTPRFTAGTPSARSPATNAPASDSNGLRTPWWERSMGGGGGGDDPGDVDQDGGGQVGAPDSTRTLPGAPGSGPPNGPGTGTSPSQPNKPPANVNLQGNAGKNELKTNPGTEQTNPAAAAYSVNWSMVTAVVALVAGSLYVFETLKKKKKSKARDQGERIVVRGKGLSSAHAVE